MSGRPQKKPEYNPELQFQNFLQELREVYEESDSLRMLAAEMNITLLKLRKLLITAGIFTSDICAEVNELYQGGRRFQRLWSLQVFPELRFIPIYHIQKEFIMSKR